MRAPLVYRFFHQPCDSISWISKHFNVGPVYWMAVDPSMSSQHGGVKVSLSDSTFVFFNMLP